MQIRPTEVADLVYLDAIFDTCRDYMAKQGNPTQWDQNYPTSQVVAQDIKDGTAYVCVDDQNNVIGSFAVGHYEEQYDHIYDGQWSCDEPYNVVHRMACIPHSGAGQHIFAYLMQKYQYIRIDTHADNKTMLHILQKLNFKPCGKVSYEGYGERVTFDYHQ